MGLLRICLFGTVRISHDDWPAEIKVTPKAQALLAYLLLKGQRCHSRERLADLFWGEASPDRARGCLSTTLWRLRHALEPDHILPGTYLVTTSRDEIGFNWESEHWLDALTFEKEVSQIVSQSINALQAAEVQMLEQMLPLYIGDLLEGFYNDWSIREQARLRSLYLDCLEHLMRYYQQHGLYEQGLHYGQKILEHEPSHETIHRELMRIYLANGQRDLAVQQYETCCEILAQELALPPMEETRMLYRQAVTTAQARTTVVSSQMALPQALQQLGSAVRDFDEAQLQLGRAKQRLDEAQKQLKRAFQLIVQSIDP
jgi:DNA-binding SARP family transcriptional activator